jgi:hypothetical protein
MMTLIFACLTLSLCLVYLGRARIAVLCLLATLGFSIGLFLFEVYNPEYGFRMPWISVSLPVTQGEG